MRAESGRGNSPGSTMEQGNTLDHREDEETRKGTVRKGKGGDVLDEKPETGKKDDRKTDPKKTPLRVWCNIPWKPLRQCRLNKIRGETVLFEVRIRENVVSPERWNMIADDIATQRAVLHIGARIASTLRTGVKTEPTNAITKSALRSAKPDESCLVCDHPENDKESEQQCQNGCKVLLNRGKKLGGRGGGAPKFIDDAMNSRWCCRTRCSEDIVHSAYQPWIICGTPNIQQTPRTSAPRINSKSQFERC